MVTAVTIGIAVILAAVFILATAKKASPATCAALKFLAGLGFVAVALSAYFEGGRAAPLYAFVLVLLGLIFGMGGDALLAMRGVFPKKEKLFILLGILSFLIGHVLYIVMIGLRSGMSFIEPLCAVAGGVLYTVLCVKMFRFDYGKLLIPAAVYTSVLLFMLACSVGALVHAVTIATVLIFCGAILFVVSDMLLSFIFFADKKAPLWTTFNLATYFPAQLLIALSLMFLI